MVARRGDAPAKKNDHQIGGLAANAPANEETKAAGNAPAKCNNAKSVAALRGMRRQTKQHQIGGSAANAPAKRKRMWRGDEMRRPNSNTKSVGRRRMRRQTKEDAARLISGRTKKRRGADGMRRPNK